MSTFEPIVTAASAGDGFPRWNVCLVLTTARAQELGCPRHVILPFPGWRPVEVSAYRRHRRPNSAGTRNLRRTPLLRVEMLEHGAGNRPVTLFEVEELRWNVPAPKDFTSVIPAGLDTEPGEPPVARKRAAKGTATTTEDAP